MSILTDPLDPGCALAASDPAVFGGVEAGGTKWVCARAPAQPISPRPSADRPDSGEGALSGYIELAREVGNIDRSHRRRLRRGVPALGFVCASVVVAGAEVVWVERAPSVSYLSTPDRGAGQFRRLDEES